MAPSGYVCFIKTGTSRYQGRREKMPFFFVTGRRSALVTYEATFEVEADDEQAVIKVIRDLDGADGVAWRLDAEDPEGETVFDVLPIEGEE